MIVSSTPDAWLDVLRDPLSRRVGPAPHELINYISQVNSASNNLYRTESTAVAADLLDDIRAAIDEIPDPVKKRLETCMLGVYLAKGVGSSAITDVVMKNAKEVIGYVTVLDADVFMNRTANEWATWKENSPFESDGPYSIEATIESVEKDNRKNAMQYLLLHEFGHALSAGNLFLPNWWISPHLFKSSDEYTFLSISWQIAMSNDIIPLLKDDFPLRGRVKYYANNRLANHEIVTAYEALEKTGFPSLYAATSAYEDFAESFASYVHTILMKKPYVIRVCRQGEIIMNFENYWSSARCSEKYRLLTEYLANA